MASQRLSSTWNSVSYWWTYAEEAAHTHSHARTHTLLQPTNSPFDFKFITASKNGTAAPFRTISDGGKKHRHVSLESAAKNAEGQDWKFGVRSPGWLQWWHCLRFNVMNWFHPVARLGSGLVRATYFRESRQKEYFPTTSTCCNISVLSVSSHTKTSLINVAAGNAGARVWSVCLIKMPQVQP